MQNLKSQEEQTEFEIKKQLKALGIQFYYKTDKINDVIEHAFKAFPSKSGGSGKNTPDIKLILQTSDSNNVLREIPIMIEVKGTQGKLAKLSHNEVDNYNKNGQRNYKNIQEYALNGAVHYAEAILDYYESHYKEAIAIGVNGYPHNNELKIEYAFYYLSQENLNKPKKIGDFSDLSCLSSKYHKDFIAQIDKIFLSDKEKQKLQDSLEDSIETSLNSLNQFLHDDLYNINPNERVSLLVGMIMTAQGVKDKINPLKYDELSIQGSPSNDGEIFMLRIEKFLESKNLPKEKITTILNEVRPAFIESKLYQNQSYTNRSLLNSAESPLKKSYKIVLDSVMPLIKKLAHADVAGKLFNNITKWMAIPDNEKNDVVLTPRYVVDLMVELAEVNKDSFVWDYATGSGAFLISAMNAMIKDAQKSIKSPKELELKIAHIKANQLLGIEKRHDIYLLAVLNMILLDDGSANLLHKDSLKEFNGSYEQGDKRGQDFPADVFLLNPPYSAKDSGFIFVDRALRQMKKGKAAVIIKENAGSGGGKQWVGHTKEILTHSTLLASIKMPIDLFIGKSSVQTAIYVFEVGKPHNKDKLVKFIDFSFDGYKRQYKKKAKVSANLKDIDNAKGRYAEIVAIVNGTFKETHYYDDFFIEDTINLEGRDWTYSQHKKIDTTPTLADFKKCVSEYLAWEVSNVLKNSCHTERSEVSKNTKADSINGGMEGNALSPRLAKLENDFKQNGGEWKSFKIGELFDVGTGSLLVSQDLKQGNTPRISAKSDNNGILGYFDTESNSEARHCENFISVNFFGDTFYHPYKASLEMKVHTLKLKNGIFTKTSGLFIAGIIKKVFYGKFTYGNQLSSSKLKSEDYFISLPVLPTACHTDLERSEREVSQNIESKKDFSPTAQNDKNTKSNFKAQTKPTMQGYKIAFNYMESYIKELEAERLQELEAYLKVTGLNDYTLSQKEKEALKAFENLSTLNERVIGISHEMPIKALQDSTLTDSREWHSFANTALSTLAQKELESSSAKNDIEWKSFNFDKVFKYERGKRYKKLDHTSGQIPYISSSALNNGIDNYVNPPSYMKRYDNKITLANSGSVGSCFYHSYEFVASDHCMVVWLKDRELNRYLALFFNAIFEKALKPKYEFSREINHERLMAETFFLPTKDNTIDFTFMESFIKAIEKQHIETLYRFWESKLKAYNAVINGGGG